MNKGIKEEAAAGAGRAVGGSQLEQSPKEQSQQQTDLAILTAERQLWNSLTMETVGENNGIESQRQLNL